MYPMNITHEVVQDAVDERDELLYGVYTMLRSEVARYANIDSNIDAFIVGMFVGAILERRDPKGAAESGDGK